jgi:hypothetical protein
MASSKIIYDQPINTKSISIAENYNAKIFPTAKTARVFDKSFRTQSIKRSDFYNAKVIQSKRQVRVSQKLPFYVKFENIIGGYSRSNPAPIGVAVIGFNNYIL